MKEPLKLTVRTTVEDAEGHLVVNDTMVREKLGTDDLLAFQAQGVRATVELHKLAEAKSATKAKKK